MVAVTEHMFGSFAYKARTNRQPAAQALRGRYNVHRTLEVHIGVQPSAASVARLHFVRNEQHVVFIAQLPYALHETVCKGHHSAFALYHLQNHRAATGAFDDALDIFDIIGFRIGETGGERAEILMEMVLPRCGKHCYPNRQPGRLVTPGA